MYCSSAVLPRPPVICSVQTVQYCGDEAGGLAIRYLRTYIRRNIQLPDSLYNCSNVQMSMSIPVGGGMYIPGISLINS